MHASFQQPLQLQECLSTMFFLSVSPHALQMKNTIRALRGSGYEGQVCRALCTAVGRSRRVGGSLYQQHEIEMKK